MTNKNRTQTPLVSVVVPILNGMRYLDHTMESILAQDYPNVELVIVDGGSIDGSREWVENFAAMPATKDFLTPGSGAAANWTRCSELATGDYVKLVCQDDLLYPSALSAQVQDFLDHPQAKIAFAQRDIISASGKVLIKSRGCQGLDQGLVSGHSALLAGYVSGTNIYGEPEAVMFERVTMQSALPWEDAEPFLLDMFFYSKILDQHPAVVRHQSIGAFRISSASWSTKLVSEQRRQFKSWQCDAARRLGRVSRLQKTRATLNNEKTSLLRRMAYLWLGLKNQME